jgi:hypothetical protein
MVSGCHLIIPEISHQPVIHNPFPQLSKIAVVPFFNQSDEPTVDGREFALAYFAELQTVPGFEVVPLGVVEEAIIDEQIDISNPTGIRKLAEVLEVDAVVVGAITDYSPYYPPRCGLRVEWYARNQGFHEIPAGYGLPWGTPDEEFIPAPLVFEAEMALAKAQLATQSPDCPKPVDALATPLTPLRNDGQLLPPQPPVNGSQLTPGGNEAGTTDAAMPAPGSAAFRDSKVIAASCEESCPCDDRGPDAPPVAPSSVLGAAGATTIAGGDTASTFGVAGMTGGIGANAMLPPDWPDERGFIPLGPSPVRPPCIVNGGPVMTHTRIYIGNDSEFTEALASYYSFRDDARFGGWQNYLQRSSDFIRFCCHMHISEMLSARGGAGETRVVWRWPESR